MCGQGNWWLGLHLPEFLRLDRWIRFFIGRKGKNKIYLSKCSRWESNTRPPVRKNVHLHGCISFIKFNEEEEDFTAIIFGRLSFRSYTQVSPPLTELSSTLKSCKIKFIKPTSNQKSNCRLMIQCITLHCNGKSTKWTTIVGQYQCQYLVCSVSFLLGSPQTPWHNSEHLALSFWLFKNV